MESKIKILLVDDNSLFRKGLKAIFTDYPELQVIGDLSTVQNAEELLSKEIIDIVLVDSDFRTIDIWNQLKSIKSKYKSLKIVIFSLRKSKLEFLNAIRVGIDGYFLKNDEIEELIQNIRKVVSGEFIISDELIKILVDLVIDKHEIPTQSLISERELQVLRCIQQGYSNSQISKEIFLSENTIKTHIKHIFKKLSVNTRKDAVEKGILWGILE